MSERFIPVTSESQLQPGVCVKLKFCGRCGTDHVFFLMRRESERHFHPEHSATGCPYLSWLVEPALCVRTPQTFCAPFSIQTGRLFILDTGLDAAAEQAQGRADAAPRLPLTASPGHHRCRSISTDERNRS